jgi:hypothetical protein
MSSRKGLGAGPFLSPKMANKKPPTISSEGLSLMSTSRGGLWGTYYRQG